MYLRGIAYGFAASFLFGLGAVIAKFLSSAFAPSIVAVVTLALSGLLLLGTVALMRIPLLPALRSFQRRDWLDVFLLACPGTALPLLVIIFGFSQTSALEGGLLQQLNGVFALFFAVLLLGDRIRLKQGLGIALLLLGGVLIVVAGTNAASGSSLGNLLILVGTIGIGFAYIPGKRLAGRIHALPLTAVRLLIGAATIAPVPVVQLLIPGQRLLWQGTPANLTIILIYSITNFCLAFLAQQAGLGLLKAWQIAAITQTVPVFSTLFAILLLHERLTLLQAAGGLLAIVGGIIVSLNNEPAQPAFQAAAPVLETSETKQAPLSE